MIFALGMILASVVSQITAAVITSRRQKKNKTLEVFFEHQLTAYRTYMSDLKNLVIFLAMEQGIFNEGSTRKTADHIFASTLLESQSNCSMFSSKKLYDKINKCDDFLGYIIRAKDKSEFSDMALKINEARRTILEEIQKEIKMLKR